MKYPKLTLFCIFCPMITGLINLIIIVLLANIYDNNLNEANYNGDPDLANINSLILLTFCFFYSLSTYLIAINHIKSIRDSFWKSLLSFFAGPFFALFLFYHTLLKAVESNIEVIIFFIILSLSQILAFILFRRLYKKGYFNIEGD